MSAVKTEPLISSDADDAAHRDNREGVGGGGARRAALAGMQRAPRVRVGERVGKMIVEMIRVGEIREGKMRVCLCYLWMRWLL